MQVHRSYSDNGKLTAYAITPSAHNRAQITKEMATRGVRYAKQTKRAQLLENAMPFIIIAINTVVLSAWYLLNN